MADPKEIPYRPFFTAPERAFSTVRRHPAEDSALVFLDTNVLLAPYRASTEALSAIASAYRSLRDEKRLIVPGQVAREFAANRPALVAQLHKLVRDSRAISINGRLEELPILQEVAEYADARRHLASMQTSLKACRTAIDALVARVGSWQSTDPVLDVYRELFDSAVVKDHKLDPAGFEATRRARYDARVPPGFRDKSKDDGGGGDLLIWLTILDVAAKLERDALLVTEDCKDDWFHRSGDERLFPRYELVEEFAERTSGRAFGISSLSELLARHGAAEKVVREVREQERLPAVTPGSPRHAELLVERALRSVIALHQAEIHHSAPFLDMAVTTATGILGIEVVAKRDLRYYRTTSEQFARAQKAHSSGIFQEVVLVFVAFDHASASALDDWLAEERFLGPGIVVIAAQAEFDSLLVRTNQSKSPLLLEAFPVRR